VEPPDPIPNSEVKRSRADGSVLRACKSRSSPGASSKTAQLSSWAVFFWAIDNQSHGIRDQG
jgi:hypothetical protein